MSEIKKKVILRLFGVSPNIEKMYRKIFKCNWDYKCCYPDSLKNVCRCKICKKVNEALNGQKKTS